MKELIDCPVLHMRKLNLGEDKLRVQVCPAKMGRTRTQTHSRGRGHVCHRAASLQLLLAWVKYFQVYSSPPPSALHVLSST